MITMTSRYDLILVTLNVSYNNVALYLNFQLDGFWKIINSHHTKTVRLRHYIKNHPILIKMSFFNIRKGFHSRLFGAHDL